MQEDGERGNKRAVQIEVKIGSATISTECDGLRSAERIGALGREHHELDSGGVVKLNACGEGLGVSGA